MKTRKAKFLINMLLNGYCQTVHPPPPTPHPTHFSFHPVFLNTLSVIRTKILHVIGQFPQQIPQRIWTYIFKIPTPNSFLGKFGPKKSKLSVLPANWHTWYLGRSDVESGVRFSKFRPQKNNNNNDNEKDLFRIN